MSAPHHDSEALIPRPPLTTAALRAAIAQIAPAYLGRFVDHLDQATEQRTIAPLQGFLQQWGEFVAIHRFPARATRLRELEAEVATTADRARLDSLLMEISEITASARREAVLCAWWAVRRGAAGDGAPVSAEGGSDLRRAPRKGPRSP